MRREADPPAWLFVVLLALAASGIGGLAKSCDREPSAPPAAGSGWR